ncbi:MAG TPA: hypothetical protein PLI56_03735, partial [Exilispira sp.]|nr:hypothetical protein [Exilispira sp.]
MGQILINLNNVEYYIEKFFEENKEFKYRKHYFENKKFIVTFFAEGKECRVDLYLNEKGIKPVLVKNKKLAAPFVKFLENVGIKDEAGSHQVVLKFPGIIQSLVKYLSLNFKERISISKKDNRYTLKGYNNDEIFITIYDNTFLLQGKPYYVFQIIMNFFADHELITFDDYVATNQEFSNITTSSEIIREKIKNILVESYVYMEEAQLKSISSSFSFIDKKVKSEDYSSALTGVFKGLEGFIKKILTQEFNCKLNDKQPLSILGKNKKTNLSAFDQKTNITNEAKTHMNKLYSIYCDNRNVYLHSTVDPKQMRIIENYEEVAELRDDILRAMENAYVAIF